MVDNIASYVNEAARRLRRRLPAAQVVPIISEARQHLEDRAEELEAGGITREQAEATAVAGFGPVRPWVQDVVASAYEDGNTRRARHFGLYAVITALFGPLLFEMAPAGIRLPGSGSSLVKIFVAGALLSMLCAFRGRRPLPARILLVGAAAVVIGFFYTGFFLVATSVGINAKRTQIASEIESWRLQVSDSRSEVRLLELGLATYDAGAAKVPAALRTNDGRFIVPLQQEPGSVVRSLWYSAFKYCDTATWEGYLRSPNRSMKLYFQTKNAAPYRSVATRAEAAREWNDLGSAWHKDQKDHLAYNVHMLQAFEVAARRPATFDYHAGQVAVVGFGFLAAVLAALDAAAAWCGRFAMRLGWTGRRRQSA